MRLSYNGLALISRLMEASKAQQVHAQMLIDAMTVRDWPSPVVSPFDEDDGVHIALTWQLGASTVYVVLESDGERSL